MEGRMPHPIRDMLHGICNTVYVKDVSERCDIRNNALASNVFRFILKNIGYRASVRSMVNHLSGKCIKTGPETIDSYTEMLDNANLVERARRFDLKTKERLRTGDILYAADIDCATP